MKTIPYIYEVRALGKKVVRHSVQAQVLGSIVLGVGKGAVHSTQLRFTVEGKQVTQFVRTSEL